MNYLISKIVFFTVIVSVAFAFDCSGRHCTVRKNENGESVFDCSLEGNHVDAIIKCSYLASSNKIILSTANKNYIPIDIIEDGAFLRLVSGLFVDKININKLQFKNLNKDNFKGLENISEMSIENPITLASDTFMSLATQTKYFVLTISCTEGNSKKAFDSLLLMSKYWRISTRHCNKKLECEYSSCNNMESETKMFKIINGDISSGVSEQLLFNLCTRSKSCINEQITTSLPKTSKKPITNIRPITTTIKTIKSTESGEYRSDEYYDTLMYVVLILTSINSIVILAILVFLIFWWKKLSTSTANNKHTIILDDEDDNKYLNNVPYK